MRKTRKIGAYSLADTLAKLDGRTRAGKRASAIEKALIEHLGGQPSATQALMIDQAVQLSKRLHALDAKFAKTGEFARHDSDYYLAWSNSLARLCVRLGMKGAAQRPPSLADHLAAKRGDA